VGAEGCKTHHYRYRPPLLRLFQDSMSVSPYFAPKHTSVTQNNSRTQNARVSTCPFSYQYLVDTSTHSHSSTLCAFPTILGKTATLIRSRNPVADTFLSVVADCSDSDGHCKARRPSDRILTLLVAIKQASLLLLAVLNLQLQSAVPFPHCFITLCQLR